MTTRLVVKKTLKTDQSGLAAIFVTIIITLLVTLTVVAFSVVSNREHGQAFNRQLSSEAYYAAESGINDAYSGISKIVNENSTNPDVGNLIPSQTSCSSSGPYSQTSPISNTGDVSYSCLIVNPDPTTLSYTQSPGQSDIVELIPKLGEPGIGNIAINWATDGASSVSSCPTKPNFLSSTSAGWPGTCPAVMKVDLVAVSAAANPAITEASLESNTSSFFIYPTAGGGTVAYPALTSASVQSANCSGGSCNFSITGTNTGDDYYLRFEPIYGATTTVNISANSNGGTPLNLVGAEAQIDSTGKAQDVLRRLQVFVPINPGLNTNLSVPDPPVYAIQSFGSICKRLTVGYINGTNNTFSSVAYPGGLPALTDTSSCAAASTSPAPIVPHGTPAPSPAPQANGSASISDCNQPGNADSPDCIPAPIHPGQPRLFYYGYVENASKNPGETVLSCSWDWGNGVIQSGTGDSNSCNYGEWKTFCYPFTAADYTVTLTLNLSNGAAATNTKTLDVPYNTDQYNNTNCSTPAN